LDHSCQVQRLPHAERGVDLYETPPVAPEALVSVEKTPHMVWEPAAGPGTIVHILRAHGHAVIASDIIDYGGLHFARDFPGEIGMPAGVEAIVTNPPFRLAEAFVEHALQICPLVIMLLRLAFLESERRWSILEGCALARVHVFRKRLPMMHRAGWESRMANSGMAFGRFVWDLAHTDPTGNDDVRDQHSTARNSRLNVGQSRRATFPRKTVTQCNRRFQSCVQI
jgi:hypothetical protein